VRTVQNMLSAALADEDFYLDCIELEIEANLRRTADAPRQPLFRMPERGLTLHMFYWYPGRGTIPHEHSAWTVTAVFYNSLQVTTYDFDVASRERRLEQKNVFSAAQGNAGHIYDRCIHSPSNVTSIVTTSLHVFNSADQPCLEDEVGLVEGLGYPNAVLPDDDGERTAVVGEWTQRQLRVLSRVLSQFRGPRAADLRRRISAHADARTDAFADRMAWLARNHRCPVFGQPADAVPAPEQAEQTLCARPAPRLCA
jgi:hypothetical protein